MQSVDPGILSKSVCFSFTPSQRAKDLRFSPSCTLKRLYYWALSRFIREAYTNVTPFRYIASRTSNAVSRSCSIA